MKRWLFYIILMTWVFAMMDWKPVHYAWWHNGKYPAYAQNWQAWSQIRYMATLILCPPCGALAENFYYVLMEIEAGETEQNGVLPVGWTHNPINPHGDWMFRWGQGENRPWREVSMLSFYLYWLPPSMVWWVAVNVILRRKNVRKQTY